MTDTAMALALKRSGYETTDDELYTLACGMLRKAEMDHGRCFRAINRAYADMRRKELPEQGHTSHETHPRLAQRRIGEEGQVVADTHSGAASSPNLLRDGNEGLGSTEIQIRRALPVAHPQRERTPSERLASLKSRAESVTAGWLARYRIPGGPKLFDLRVCDVRGMAHRMAREGGERLHAAVILAALEHELSDVNGTAIVGEALTKQTIDRLNSELAIDRLKPSAVEWLAKFPKLEAITHAQ